MNLQQEVRDHVVVFHDASRKYINKQQFAVIMNQSSTQKRGIVVDGAYISFGSISKILPVNDFYMEYPSEKPAKIEEFKYKEVQRERLTHAQEIMNRKNKLAGMLKGLKEHYQKSQNEETKKMIDRLEDKMKKIQGGRLDEKDQINRLIK